MRATVVSAGRHEALDLHIGELEAQAHLAAQDDQLARDVHAGKVVARIGLGIAPCLGVAHDARRTASCRRRR